MSQFCRAVGCSIPHVVKLKKLRMKRMAIGSSTFIDIFRFWKTNIFLLWISMLIYELSWLIQITICIQVLNSFRQIGYKSLVELICIVIVIDHNQKLPWKCDFIVPLIPHNLWEISPDFIHISKISSKITVKYCILYPKLE